MLSEEARKVKAELEELNQRKRFLKSLQEELAYWENLGGAIGACGAEQCVDGGLKISYAEKRLIKIDSLDRLISEVIEEVRQIEDSFYDHVVCLDVFSQNLLMDRYLKGKSLDRIICDSNYCDRQIYRKYDSAFEKIADSKRCQ